jgi:hypothetical protein
MPSGKSKEIKCRFGTEWDTSTSGLLVYADGFNFLSHSINTIKEHKGTLLVASKDIGLDINAEKTKYMIMSRHQNSGQNPNS